MRHLKRILVIVTLLSLSVSGVYAIADPDTPPTVNAVYVFEDVLEAGDVGVFIDYFLDYAATPAETATEAYMAAFIDTDGITQLRSVSPYSYDTSGYGRGAIWIYFSAADVTTYGITSASQALYKIWLMGNPTCCSGSGGWSGDPPKTEASRTEWYTTGDPAVLLALRVLSMAAQLEAAWSVDMIEATSLGNRLTAIGAGYFINVIADLRTMAPNAFASGLLDPTIEVLDYTTTFGATMTDGPAPGGGTVTGSPITLVEGANTVTVTVAGTFTLDLLTGTVGTVADGTGTVTGSPVDVVAGANTVTVPGGGDGTLIVTVNLSNTQTDITDTVTGTALDMSDAAARFGMTTMTFSGLIWLLISFAICSGTYKVAGKKPVWLVFNICIIGGAVLGLLATLLAVLIFIAFGTLTGYVVFFRGASF